MRVVPVEALEPQRDDNQLCSVLSSVFVLVFFVARVGCVLQAIRGKHTCLVVVVVFRCAIGLIQ